MSVDRFIKRKNLLLLSVGLVSLFLLYQLGFYMTLTSETDDGNKIVPVLDYRKVKEVLHVRSEADKFINEHGVIKGVLGKNILKYRPDSRNEFKCLNSEQRIPFEQVNDDFCDCEDGTDEPSTSACPNGVFYCDTQFKKKSVVMLTVSSSKVNDGICDCCDGSDEWLLMPNKKVLSLSNDQHYRYYVTLCGNDC